MMLNLSQLKSYPASQKKRKRVGRGGKRGTYSGRGLKGQRARSGGKRKAGHLGKKSPAFIAQIPKTRGFKSYHPKLNIVNIGQLEKKFETGEIITPQKLLTKGLIVRLEPGVKILGEGKLEKKFTVMAHRFSQSAEDAIKKVGGIIKVIS